MGIVITRRDWLFIASANAIAIAIALVSAKYQLGWAGATASVAIELTLLGVFCARHPEPLFARLLVFGIVVGFTELLNDTWLIDQGILVYAPGGPEVLKTPLYMPFCWALIFVTNGTVGIWLLQKLGGWKAAIALAVMSGLYIPLFEAVAAKALWWHYEKVPMLFGLAPTFVVLSEALLALPLPWMSARLVRDGLRWAVFLGVVEGLFLWAVSALALALVG